MSNHQLLVSQKIVVGEVLSCEDVPETHLHVCQVNVGEEEARQIVCGAPNVRAGIKVMVALPGARIADNYKIKKGARLPAVEVVEQRLTRSGGNVSAAGRGGGSFPSHEAFGNLAHEGTFADCSNEP